MRIFKNCLGKGFSCQFKVKVVKLLTLQKELMLFKRVNGKCELKFQ